jgi:hypothetical protein
MDGRCKNVGDEQEDIISVGKPEANTCESQGVVGKKNVMEFQEIGMEERWNMLQVAPNRVHWAGTC